MFIFQDQEQMVQSKWVYTISPDEGHPTPHSHTLQMVYSERAALGKYWGILMGVGGTEGHFKP